MQGAKSSWEAGASREQPGKQAGRCCFPAAGIAAGVGSRGRCPRGDVPGVSGTAGTAGSSPGAGVSGLSLSLGKEGIQRVCPLFCNSQAGENSPSHPCHPPGACCCPSLRLFGHQETQGALGQASEGLGALISGLLNICSSFGHPCVPAGDFLAAQAGNPGGSLPLWGADVSRAARGQCRAWSRKETPFPRSRRIRLCGGGCGQVPPP